MHKPAEPVNFGLIARFRDVDSLMDAANRVREAGYRKVDAYTPFPIHGLSDALGMKPTKLPLIVLLAGIVGAMAGFGMQYFAQVIHYPMNIGGRPLYSWPAWIPITFEVTVLVASLAAVVGMMALNGLPRPHHPVFGVKGFDRASDDKFFLSVESTDEQFDDQKTREFLQSLGAMEVSDVPN